MSAHICMCYLFLSYLYSTMVYSLMRPHALICFCFLFSFIPEGLIHIFLRTGLLVINSLVYFLSSSVFVSPSIITDNFVLCNYPIFISVAFHNFKYTIQRLLAFNVSIY